MLVKENIETINVLLSKVFDFVRNNEKIQKDLQQYAGSVLGKAPSQAEWQSVLMSYIFDKQPENNKKVFDLYAEQEASLSDEEKNILNGMGKSISSIFEVKKVNKEGFELYNIINEKSYKTLILIKMVNFRGIIPGYYLVCRIFPYNDEYYLIGIDNVIPSVLKENAYRYAVAQQMEKPELLYQDNPEKLAEIEKAVNELGDKYAQYFQQEEIITTSQYVDDILSDFNDFIENQNSESALEQEKVILPEKYAYFEVKEVTTGVSDPMLAAVKGFSSHEKIYDVGIIFDPDSGLLVLPFFGTFKQIFSTEDHKSIQGYKDCVLKYLESERIPPAPILKVYNDNPESFKKVMIDVLGIEENFDINELVHKYKHKYLEKKRFSALTVLYLSNAFNELMDVAKDKQTVNNIPANKGVGRNDLCPCGSGKKYKKCCLK